MISWWRQENRRERIIHFLLSVPPLVLLPLLILLFFNKMAFSNLILARGDTFLYFYPYWQAAADALQDGRIPFWNPHLFMGAPFLANSQVGFFYPLNWPLWLLLPMPYAVSASILLHLFIAGSGAYFAGRRALLLGPWAALVTAVLFALGGYLTAQVEHINQLQGLAWLPWFLVVLADCGDGKHMAHVVATARAAVALTFLFTMQLLAGHSQTTFITLVMILVWVFFQYLNTRLVINTEYSLRFVFYWQRFRKRVLLALICGGGLALIVTAVQLLPTLELAQLSSRQGGLPVNEVLSFSLHPLLLARALLPGYGQSLFTEYVAFLPLSALLFACAGAWQWRQWRGVLPALALAAIGFLFALGAFNPLNWLLARLPGFDLFRVPARWLVVYTLGVSLLAGLGWQIALDHWQMRTRDWHDLPERARENLWHMERPLRSGLYLLIGLMAWSVIANLLAIFISTGPEAPYEAARPFTVLAWAAELLLVYMSLTGQRFTFNPQSPLRLQMRMVQVGSPWPLIALMVIVLFAASRTHPYNNLTTPEAYFDLRPPVARLKASLTTPPDRFLSLSDIFFDVGDQEETDTIYAEQLPASALYDYTVAIKHKEVVGPNLPMTYGLASVDGFDGGILPLRAYSQVVQVILPPGDLTTDGRLREHLDAIPEAKWLDLFNARYLIADKTGDEWRQAGFKQQDVFFDLQHPLSLAAGETAAIAYLPDFPASALVMLVEGEPGIVEVTTTDGEAWALEPFPVESGMVWAAWPGPYVRPRGHRVATPQAITLRASQGEWRIVAATLINQDDSTFLPLALGQYRLIHSGDVKIYENLDVMPRALMLFDWQWQPDVSASVAAMNATGFDPGQTAVLVGNDEGGGMNDQGSPDGDALPDGMVEILSYEPERVVVQTESEADGLLLLTDAYYPGWQTAVDDEPATLYQADGLFRGVFVPAGAHKVSFEFQSPSFAFGRLLTFAGLSVWLLLFLALLVLRAWR